MADLKVSHAPPPPPVRPVAKVAPKPPEPPKAAPKAPPPKGEAHGPAVLLGGAFAKPPVKPVANLQASQDKPTPKSAGDGKGQHLDRVI